MSELTEYKRELAGTLKRLEARITSKKVAVPFFEYTTPLEEVVMLYAQLLGAKDPYQAVLYPRKLEQVLANTLPDWMATGEPLIEIEGTRP